MIKLIDDFLIALSSTENADVPPRNPRIHRKKSSIDECHLKVYPLGDQKKIKKMLDDGRVALR